LTIALTRASEVLSTTSPRVDQAIGRLGAQQADGRRHRVGSGRIDQRELQIAVVAETDVLECVQVGGVDASTATKLCVAMLSNGDGVCAVPRRYSSYRHRLRDVSPAGCRCA